MRRTEESLSEFSGSMFSFSSSSNKEITLFLFGGGEEWGEEIELREDNFSSFTCTRVVGTAENDAPIDADKN